MVLDKNHNPFFQLRAKAHDDSPPTGEQFDIGKVNLIPDKLTICTLPNKRQRSMNKKFVDNVPGAEIAVLAVATDEAIKKSKVQSYHNDMASKLIPGSWVVFKSTDDPAQPMWLGRAVLRDEWSNNCIWKNESDQTIFLERKGCENVSILAGRYAINVQWYTQKVLGKLEYKVEQGDSMIQATEDLITTGFDDYMTPVVGLKVR